MKEKVLLKAIETLTEKEWMIFYEVCQKLPDEVFIKGDLENKIREFLRPKVFNQNRLDDFTKQLVVYLQKKDSKYLIVELKKMLSLI